MIAVAFRHLDKLKLRLERNLKMMGRLISSGLSQGRSEVNQWGAWVWSLYIISILKLLEMDGGLL